MNGPWKQSNESKFKMTEILEHLFFDEGRSWELLPSCQRGKGEKNVEHDFVRITDVNMSKKRLLFFIVVNAVIKCIIVCLDLTM